MAVSSVAYAWELGGGFGHIGPFLPLARELRQRGHAVHCIVGRVDLARQLAGEDFSWTQAPVFPEAPRGSGIRRLTTYTAGFSAGATFFVRRALQSWWPIMRQPPYWLRVP